ncbi:MAG TPA: glycosyltransferase, partial [Firmicutes bacterium]|nr:glycosyltransferase [Bacillota bacterium]
RHSNLDPEGNKRTTIWTAKACARFSNRLPNKIICCSEASKRVHAKLGYDSQKMIVIPNGFELSSFVPDPEAKLSVRKELNIPDDALIIGLAARYDPQKDHQNFIEAASILKRDYILRAQQEIYFMLCGEGVTWENREIVEPIEKAGLRQQFHLLGRRDDMPRLTAAMDIATSSSSYGEGFPNVVGEAMACEVPCVVTDVGDSAYIVGNTGRVVPVKNPDVLAKAWLELIKMKAAKRRELGAAARKRIINSFDLKDIVLRYEDMYKAIFNM